jgi:hypothetical protein
VRAVVDQSGAAHVLIADAAHLRTVEVVVGADGTTEQRVIGSMKHGIQIGIRIPYGAIDGAFDERGSLHALVGDQHYVFVDGVWQAATHTPWEDAGIDVLVARFVRGASGLVWAMEVKRKDPVLMPLRRSA